MYQKKVRIGKYHYTYYYHNVKIKGKARNVCLGRNLAGAKKKLKKITEESKKKKKPVSKIILKYWGPALNYILPIIAVLSFLSLAEQAQGLIPCYSCVNCSEELNALTPPQDTIQLQNDINDYQYMHCIYMTSKSSGSTLDCNGYTISNSTNALGLTRDGIHIYGSNPENITIINCIVDNFSSGVYIETSPSYKGATNITIKDSVFQNNSMLNLIMSDTAYSTFDNLTITCMDEPEYDQGIKLQQTGTATAQNTSYNNFTNIRIDKCHIGLMLYGAGEENIVQNLNITNIRAYGVDLSDHWNNTLRNINITKKYDNSVGIGFTINSDIFVDEDWIQNDPGQYIQNIDTSNIINEKPIMFYDSYYTPCPNNKVIEHNDTYSLIGLVNCINVTLQNTDPSDALNLFFTKNSTIQNVNVSRTYTGLNLWHGSDNFLSNITLWKNIYGVYIYSTSNNTITDMDLQESGDYSLTLDWSDFNLIENSTVAEGEGIGLYLYGSQHNIIKNVNITSNTYEGISLNYDDWYSIQPSSYNNITECRITDNNVGIYIDSDSIGSYVYNNIFNNTLNADISNTQNYWNTTKTQGTNIIGGPNIGGNYWSDYLGTDTDSDGIGDDDTYNITASVEDYDYLPLVFFNDITAPTLTLEAPDDNAFNTTTNMIDFTYNVTDDGILSNCSLIINDEINATDTTMQKDTAGQTFTVNLPNADYLWSVNCTDESNNIGTSETRNISINYISSDLTCNSCDNCNAVIASASAGQTVALTANISNRVGTCIEFRGKDSITFDCAGFTIDGDNDPSFYECGINISDASQNNTIKNCIVTEFGFGLVIGEIDKVNTGSEWNTIRDSTFTLNKNNGLQVQGGNNNNYLTNITTRGNTLSGIDIRSSFNIIENSLSELNGDTGLLLINPDNLVVNLTLNSNNNGIMISEFATGNNITNCTIEHNTLYGIHIYQLGDYGVIYNNIFNNNTNNAYAEINTVDYWNNTKTSGENIILGPTIGGNYWSDYNGSDDDNDGIGEEPYYIQEAGMDYLPLATPSSTPPTVILEAPEGNTTNTTTNLIDFTYNVNDNYTLSNCSLIINDEINATDTTMQKDTAGQTFTVYLPNADYYWSVNCTDNSNNIGNSETRNININLAAETSLSVTSAHVNPSKALNGTAINITATVTATGGTVSSVNAMLHYPNGTNFENTTMSDTGDGTYYNDTYTADFNIAGTYTVMIHAEDSNNNVNNTEQTNFAPYIEMSNEADINIDGVFSDWTNLLSLTDQTGDTYLSTTGVGLIQNASKSPSILENPQDNNAYLGSSLRIADINNDGIADIIAGAPEADNSGNDAGRLYIWYGTNGNFSDMNGTEPNVTLENPEPTSSYFADHGAITLGDFNGDGLQDVAAGCSNCYVNGIYAAGIVYIWYNNGNGITNGSEPNTTLENRAGYQSAMGKKIITGDTNNDGVDDLIVSAIQTNRLYIYYGINSTTGIANVSEPNITLLGPDTSGYDESFPQFLTMGDVDGNGIKDLIAYGMWMEGSQLGKANIYYIDTGGINNDTLPNSTLLAWGEFAVGNINNDNYDDFIAVDYGNDAPPDPAKIKIWYGSSNGINNNSEPDITLYNPTLKNYYDSRFGVSIQPGDLNNDGLTDLVVGAELADYLGTPNNGAAYIWYGPINNGSQQSITIESQQNGDNYLGNDLGIGDVDNDGVPNLVISAYSDTKPPGTYTNAGRIYIFAPESTSQASLDLMQASLANNDTTLFALIQTNDKLDFSDANYYKIFISTNDDVGRDTAIDTGQVLPFNYTYLINISGNACGLYNDSNLYLGSCDFSNDTTTIEVGLALSSINLVNGSSINATLATGNTSMIYDFIPNNASFISYTVSLTPPPDTTPPTINLESPADSSIWTLSDTVTFYYNVSDASNLANCTLILNYDSIASTSTSMVKGTAGQSFSTALSNGDYNWSVNCTDENSNIGGSEVWSLSVSYSPPSGGGSRPEPPAPPEVPPVPPAPPVPPVIPPAPPVTPTVEVPSGPSGREEGGRSNVRECWSSGSSLTASEIEAASYLFDMIPCPDVVPVEAKEIKKRAWCNGIEIDLENIAAIKVGFIRGKAQYNLNLGGSADGYAYCPWCDNGVKDYDEEGVDCGGPSCSPCVKVEKPAVFIDLKCGDKKCQEGNEYVCPKDCRNLNLTLLLIALLLIALLINSSLWEYYKRKGRLNKTKNVVFGLNTLIIGGALIYVITQYICTSPIDCEYFILITGLIGVSAGFFITVFKGVAIMKRTGTLITYLGLPPETKQKLIEIKSLVIKGKKNILQGDTEAAEILYSAIEPIYESLNEREKRRVIEIIKRLHREIIKARNGKDLNI